MLTIYVFLDITFVQKCKNDATCIKDFAFNSICKDKTCGCKDGNVFDYEKLACTRSMYLVIDFTYNIRYSF